MTTLRIALVIAFVGCLAGLASAQNMTDPDSSANASDGNMSDDSINASEDDTTTTPSDGEANPATTDTPGFGAILAVAALGILAAVLTLRRK